MNFKEATSRDIIIKLQKNEDKVTKENDTKSSALNVADFLSESLETRRQWGRILLKQENRNCHSSILHPGGIKKKVQMKKKINRMCHQQIFHRTW